MSASLHGAINMTNTNGLKFEKFDLHVHTPASNDHKNKSITAEDIVAASTNKGLAGIAITDHQTGAWVDSIKKAAEKTDLSIFPGVELKVVGGEEGVHVVVIFNIDKDTAHVTAFLNTLNVYEHNGKPDLITTKTVMDVANELQKFDPAAILILAHANSSAGVGADMKGLQRSEIFKPEYKCVFRSKVATIPL